MKPPRRIDPDRGLNLTLALWLVVLALPFIGAALAEEAPWAAVGPSITTSETPGALTVISPHGTASTIVMPVQRSTLHMNVATISPDGTVYIDWARTDAAASAHRGSVGDFTSALAKLMVAVRDGTWKPMGEKKP